MIPRNLEEKLAERERTGNVRSLPVLVPGLTDFCGNDYLGFSAALTADGHLPAGSTGSRLISGNHPVFYTLENEILPAFHGFESALFFASGYTANTGLFSCIAGRGDTILYDEKVHASIRDGIRLGLSKAHAFRHNSVEDLEARIQRASGQVFVAVESIYSMDGDLAPLQEIAALCKRYRAFLIADEAHALGVYGKGLIDEYRLQQEVFAAVFTYGKAFGTHGAAVCGPEILKRFLLNFSRPFIYTTAPAPEAVQHVIDAYTLFSSGEGQRRYAKLREMIAYWNAGPVFTYFSRNPSAIQCVYIQGNEAARSLEQELQQSGFSVRAILHPTVAEGEERIRISLGAARSEAEIDRLKQVIHSFFAT